MSEVARREFAETAVVHLTVDGRGVEASPGELLIDAAEKAGVFIPRFCYHPRLEPVGMCRMCLVEVSGPRGFTLQPACMAAVAEGQEVRTSSPKARKAQQGVLEFLLINHPLDCPVCDKGGECPLQDQALSHGPGESRFSEEKRHWAKPIEIGPLVLLDRERCIQCARCTRFADEVAGEPLIDLAFRSDAVEVATFPNRPFDSYFSGNTIQICPVGALTAPAYRFASRPWDLEQVETTCTTCAVGCRVVAQSSAGRLVRYLGVDSDPVNQSWLCDKGRYGFEAVHSPNRLVAPLAERDDIQVPVTWHEALDAVTAAIRDAHRRGGPESVAILGGARLSNEDAYAWAKLAKAVLGTDSVDAQLDDGLPAAVVLGLPHATIDEATQAKAVITLTGDVREELPVLFLRLRRAALEGLAIVECSTSATALTPYARNRLAYLPGEIRRLAEALVGLRRAGTPTGVDPAALAASRALLRSLGASGEGLVVVCGRPSSAEPAAAVAAAAETIRRAFPDARFLPALRRANVHGALDMGLAPGLLPGRVTLDDARSELLAAWGSLPAQRGRDARAILEAAVNNEITTLMLLGCDPLADCPDRALARAALEQIRSLVYVGTHPNGSSSLAQVVLPVAGDGERGGTTTNCEGRVTRLAAKVVPPGIAWPAWTVASEIARRFDAPLGCEGVEQISAEIARVAPAYRGVDAGLLGRPNHRDGVVVPLRAAPVGISGRRLRPIDPVATPGILSVEEQGAPLDVGSALPAGSGGVVWSAEPVSATPTRLMSFSSGDGLPAAGELANGAYRLVVRRTLYDRGTLVAESPSLAPLTAKPAVFVHRLALEAIGAVPGAMLTVRSAQDSVRLPVEVDDSLPRNVALLVANLVGPDEHGASALVDSSEAATDVWLEMA
ncbi:MAG TPA: NADH-quinone oxidoreductase subunit NuoG [Acidimicrobiales bacterium]|nr:NADH-quinone oxidoreductase subunit NuoG [Acidimicrobiales bacterium]